MKNNDVKKVVFYSTRQIIPYFSEDHLVQCDSMITYFSQLKDELSEWLSTQALLSEYLQIITEIGPESEQNGCKDVQEITNIVSSIVVRAKKEDPCGLLDDLTNRVAQYNPHEDQSTKTFWRVAYDLFVKLNKMYFNDDKRFLPAHFEKHKDYVLSGKVTHLNIGSDEQKLEALLKYRLGIYHKEENEYAVAAIWPWAGEMEPNHNENWKNTIANAIREFYPQCDEILLAIHDNDFANLKDNEKDAILFVGKKVSKMNDQNAESDSASDVNDPRISLIVFQHTNKNVLKPILKKDNEGGLYSTKEVWEEISRYLKRDSLREADNNDSVAQKHNSTDNA